MIEFGVYAFPLKSCVIHWKTNRIHIENKIRRGEEIIIFAEDLISFSQKSPQHIVRSIESINNLMRTLMITLLPSHQDLKSVNTLMKTILIQLLTSNPYVLDYGSQIAVINIPDVVLQHICNLSLIQQLTSKSLSLLDYESQIAVIKVVDKLFIQIAEAKVVDKLFTVAKTSRRFISEIFQQYGERIHSRFNLLKVVKILLTTRQSS